MRITVLFILLFLSASKAQFNYDLNQFGEETVEFLKQPGRWNGDDYLTIALIAGGTYSLMFLDDAIKSEMLKDRSYVGSVPLEFAKYWGEPIPAIALGGVLYLHGLITDDNTTKKIGFEIGQSMIFTASVTQVLKISFGRARPYTEKGPFCYHPFQSLSEDNWALPSGHTSLAFSLSTILAGNSESDFIKGLAYIPAFMTAFSRIYYNRHWTSDVFLGAFIGYFVGRFVLDLHEQNEDMNLETFTHRPILSISFTF
jgi:membrane-associated phospholipid phosphatase